MIIGKIIEGEPLTISPYCQENKIQTQNNNIKNKNLFCLNIEENDSLCLEQFDYCSFLLSKNTEIIGE